jgi:hypothetical protein
MRKKITKEREVPSLHSSNKQNCFGVNGIQWMRGVSLRCFFIPNLARKNIYGLRFVLLVRVNFQLFDGLNIFLRLDMS